MIHNGSPLASTDVKCLGQKQRPPGGREFPDRHLVWLAIFCVLASLQILLFLIEVPPLGDYHNHLARILIVNSLTKDPVLSRFFDVEISPIPNLAFDFLVLMLSHTMSPYIAGKVFVGLTLAVTVGGICYLHKTVFGRWSFWPMIAGLFAFHQIFLGGFLNYTFGIGLSFFLLAFWIQLARTSWSVRLLLGAVFALTIYFVHALAFGVYAFCVGVLEFHTCISNRDNSFVQRVGRLVLAGVPLILPLLLFLATTNFLDQWNVPRGGYNLQLDLAILGFFAAALAYAAGSRQLHVSWPLIFMSGALAVIFIFVHERRGFPYH